MLTLLVEIRGASFQLQSDRLLAKVNARYGGMLDVGADLVFVLRWDAPYLTAIHEQTSVKSFRVPTSLFQLDPLRVNLQERLPALVASATWFLPAMKLKSRLILGKSVQVIPIGRSDIE